MTIKHKEETRYCLRIVLALTIFRTYKLLGVQVHHPELRTKPTFGNVNPIVRHYTDAEASSHYQQPLSQQKLTDNKENYQRTESTHTENIFHLIIHILSLISR